MGGLGSGSWYRWDTRRVIDTVDCLDVRRLARQGALRAGVRAIITWRQGQQGESSVKLTGERQGIVLTYRAQRGGAWQTVHQEIAVETGTDRVWYAGVTQVFDVPTACGYCVSQ